MQHVVGCLFAALVATGDAFMMILSMKIYLSSVYCNPDHINFNFF
jgi:hypothetical protein